MRTVPRNRLPQITYFKVRAARWAAEAEALKLDPEQIARLQTKVEAARQAFEAQQVAHARARSKTAAFHAALEAMNAEGASVISQIRTQSFTLGSEAYRLGWIPAPEKGSPIAPPGTPYNFKTQLTQLGSLILRWSCDNPRGARGTTYHISRQLEGGAGGGGGGAGGGGGGGFEFLGIAGRKKFEDTTLPRGVKGAIYRVQAFRSTSAGPVATHTVYFGFNGHGLPVPGKMQLGKTRLAA